MSQLSSSTYSPSLKKKNVPSGTSDKIGTIQRRLAWPCARMTRTNREMVQLFVLPKTSAIDCENLDFTVIKTQAEMWRCCQNLLRRASSGLPLRPHSSSSSLLNNKSTFRHIIIGSNAAASSPSVSIWRRKKEMGKEGLMVAKELKRLQSNPIRLERFMKSNVSRLLKSDLLAVLAEFQRQDLIFLSMKMYEVVRKEIWYRPDMFFYRDMLLMLAKNKRVDEAKKVWEDLKSEGVLFDQHTFGDLVRAFLDSGLCDEAMHIYDEMRSSTDPPLSLPYRVILKGLLPYPDLREKVKDDFLELFPDMIIYDPPEDLFDDEEWRKESEEEIIR